MLPPVLRRFADSGSLLPFHHQFKVVTLPSIFTNSSHNWIIRDSEITPKKRHAIIVHLFQESLSYCLRRTGGT